MTLPFSTEEYTRRLERIRSFPDELEALVDGLNEERLKAHTIPGEWSVQQIVHHLADSHLNSMLRMKFILTMERPHLQGYDQDVWAELPDINAVPIGASLAIVRGLHARWAVLFETLTPEQWSRTGVHSERGEIPMSDFLVTYSDHCDIHIDQIKRVLAASVSST